MLSDWRTMLEGNTEEEPGLQKGCVGGLACAVLGARGNQRRERSDPWFRVEDLGVYICVYISIYLYIYIYMYI